MEFRPCIDIHNGQVKQIVGSSLSDIADFASENFVSNLSAQSYSDLYYDLGIKGGHVIMLNPITSPHYNDTKDQALSALSKHPGYLQIGGGINCDNAIEFLDAGASHIIVTSYVFKDGIINYANLNKLVKLVGKEKIVLDLSCKMHNGKYHIVTNRWQTISDEPLTSSLLINLSKYCDEFLIHAVDVEGKCNGIEESLISLLSNSSSVPVTYAGGVASIDDIYKIKQIGNSKINVTIGSALDLFGGPLRLNDVLMAVKD